MEDFDIDVGDFYRMVSKVVSHEGGGRAIKKGLAGNPVSPF